MPVAWSFRIPSVVAGVARRPAGSRCGHSDRGRPSGTGYRHRSGSSTSRVQALRGSHAGEAEATARDVARTSKVTDVTVTVSTTDSLVRVDVEGRASALFGAAVAVRGHAVAVEEGT